MKKLRHREAPFPRIHIVSLEKSGFAPHVVNRAELSGHPSSRWKMALPGDLVHALLPPLLQLSTDCWQRPSNTVVLQGPGLGLELSRGNGQGIRGPCGVLHAREPRRTS